VLNNNNNIKYFSLLNLRIIIVSILNKLRKKYLVFLFFVALSALAWYIRALKEIYVVEVKYPVCLYNVPSNYLILNEPVKNVTLHLSATGFSILSYKLKPIKSFDLDFSNFIMHTDCKDSCKLFLPFRQVGERFKSESDRYLINMELLSISPDTLYLEIKNSKKNAK
jgi:hypothetical protein